MKTYIKYLIYYSLTVFDSIINLLCSFLRYYPGRQTAEDFIFNIEYGKAGKVVKERTSERVNKANLAREDMQTAHDTIEEIDIYGKRH